MWSDSSQEGAVLVVGLGPLQLIVTRASKDTRQKLYLLHTDLQYDFSGQPSPALWSCLRSTGIAVAKISPIGERKTDGKRPGTEVETQITEPMG